jgi:hypothetical protein
MVGMLGSGSGWVEVVGEVVVGKRVVGEVVVGEQVVVNILEVGEWSLRCRQVGAGCAG